MQFVSLTPAPIRTFAEIETLGPICPKMVKSILDENKVHKTVERRITLDFFEGNALAFMELLLRLPASTFWTTCQVITFM